MTEVVAGGEDATGVVVHRIDRRHVVFLTGLSVAPILAVNGGYFPTSWGWAALGFAWAAGLAALFVDFPGLARPDWVLAGALTALVAWTALSKAWAISPTAAPLETERALVFLAGIFAALLLVGRRHADLLVGGAAAAAGLISVYALATRLFPDRLGVVDTVAGYRLSTPVGYWNSLGLVAAIATLLVIAVIAETEWRSVRVLSAWALPLLAATLYYTFSRGAWIALIVGFAALLVFERSRLPVLGRVLPSLALTAAAVLVAAHERALTHLNASNAEVTHEGHRLAVILIGIGLASAGVAFLADRAVRVLATPEWLPRIASIALWILLVAVVAGGIVRFGAPQTVVRHAYHSFVAPSPEIGSNLNARLFNLSGSGRWTQWKVAWRAFEHHPLLGIGAGGYERYWLQHRPVGGKIRDAHNLYVETLAETGIVGFAILVTVLSAPFLALRRARQQPLAAGALAAYIAYLVHAAVDWDWELSGVTLLALFCGVSLLIGGRHGRLTPVPRSALVAVAAVIGLASLVGLAGNIALAKGADAARAGNWAAAARDARQAHTWAPWSAQPWQQLGEAQLGEGDTASSVRSFHRALQKSPGDWNLWFDLARATTGSRQREALAHARQLNPLSPEIAELRSELAAEKVIEVTQK